MKYSKLFDTLHSSTISESVKEDLVSKVLDRIVLEDIDLLEESLNEGEDKVSTYVEVLSTLVNSTLTNEALAETMDMIFANESQEIVDAVEEAFKEDVVKGILVSQLLYEEGIDEDAAPVGLSAIRRAAGEPAIKPVKKPEPSVSKTKEQFHTRVTPTPQPKAEAPKATTQPKSSVNAGAGEGNSLSGSKTGSTYRYVNTARIKKAAEQARKGTEERQQRREARISASKERQKEALKSTGSSKPIQAGEVKTSSSDNTEYFKKQAEEKQKEALRKQVETESAARKSRVEARLAANKAKQEASLSKTGSSEPIIDDTARLKKAAEEKQKQAQKALEKEKKKTTKVNKKLDNKPSTKVTKNKVTSKKAPDVEGQQKLDLTSTKTKEKPEVKTEETKKEVKETKPKNKITLNIGKHKQAEIKEPEKEEKQEPSKTPEKKPKPSVYIKGGNAPSKRKEENFDASREEQERYSLRKQIMDMRDAGKVGTPEYKELKAKYNALKPKSANEALSESLAHLFTSNISEFTLKSIFEMVAANKKNANKVLRRNEDKLAVAVNNLSDNLAKTGKADPELIGKAEKALKHKEDFERRYDNKFNKEK